MRLGGIQNVQGLKDILPDEYQELASEEIRAITKIAKYVKEIPAKRREAAKQKALQAQKAKQAAAEKKKQDAAKKERMKKYLAEEAARKKKEQDAIKAANAKTAAKSSEGFGDDMFKKNN